MLTICTVYASHTKPDTFRGIDIDFILFYEKIDKIPQTIYYFGKAVFLRRERTLGEKYIVIGSYQA